MSVSKPELSYVDLLEKLRMEIEADVIPADDKRIIANHIDELERVLWKYSA